MIINHFCEQKLIIKRSTAIQSFAEVVKISRGHHEIGVPTGCPKTNAFVINLPKYCTNKMNFFDISNDTIIKIISIPLF